MRLALIPTLLTAIAGLAFQTATAGAVDVLDPARAEKMVTDSATAQNAVETGTAEGLSENQRHKRHQIACAC